MGHRLAIRLAMVACAAALFAAPVHASEPTDGYFTTSDGIKIHYLTQGTVGSWVVLIHGYTGNAQGNWFDNGVAPALAKKHRVVAIDCRNHGKSDKPELGGRGLARDVVELMDHLKIQKAHVHGYSMGGSITAQLLATIPDRIVTAAFGGSGVRETDPEKAKAAEALDSKGVDPQEVDARRGLRIHAAMANGMSEDAATKQVDEQLKTEAAAGATPQVAAGTRTPPPQVQIDLTQVKIPVIAIIGEYDSPNARTARMQRELPGFKLTLLPGKSHLTAIAAPYMPKEYVETLVAFVDGNDPK
jgi:pimeloyl-ACP methyl ester carboxylesterase